jgi:hypothetical protein
LNTVPTQSHYTKPLSLNEMKLGLLLFHLWCQKRHVWIVNAMCAYNAEERYEYVSCIISSVLVWIKIFESCVFSHISCICVKLFIIFESLYL